MIYYFNPGHETAVLNASPYYTLPANLLTMQKELAFLPAWYALGGSEVLSEYEISDDWIDGLKRNLNFDIYPILPKALRYRPNVDISFWGISIQAIQTFKEWEKSFEASVNLPKWDEQYVYLNGRRAGLDCLTKLIKLIPQISRNILPTYHSSLDEIEKSVANSPLPLLAKAPYSSSGRGLLRLPIGGLTRTERQILQGMLNKQRELSLEIKLDKQVDFAMEFMSNGKGNIQFAGYSLFKTNEKGAYLGNYIDSQENIEKHLLGYIDKELLDTVKKNLTDIIKDTYSELYEGCIGVDMLIYADKGVYKLHPCVEINMRYNMGYLACQFSKNYLADGSKGFFHIDFDSRTGETFAAHKRMEEEYPTEFSNGRFKKGYFTLCPVHRDSKYRAYVVIDNTRGFDDEIRHKQ